MTVPRFPMMPSACDCVSECRYMSSAVSVFLGGAGVVFVELRASFASCLHKQPDRTTCQLKTSNECSPGE